MSLAEIIALLGKIEGLGELIAQAWKDMQERAAQEADEDKREKLLEAIKAHDVAAVRAVLFSVGQ